MTSVSFPDLSVTSSSTRYVFEAKSPDNRMINRRDGSAPDESTVGYEYGCEQNDFRYQLIDSDTSQVIWEQWQGENDPSPTALYVSDEGWTVIHMYGGIVDYLVALSPVGVETGRIEVSYPDKDGPNQLLQREDRLISYKHEHVHPTTAGLSWTGGSHAYFLPHADLPCFVWLTGWADRIGMRIQTGELVIAEGEFLEQCHQQENQDALKRLTEAAVSLQDYDGLDEEEDDEEGDDVYDRFGEWGDLETMLAIVARNRVEEAVLYLEAIIPRCIRWEWTGSHALPNDDFEIAKHSFRAKAKLAMRILGYVPEEYACYTFFEIDFSQDEDDGEIVVLELRDLTPDRESRLSDLNQSMDSLEVLKLIGAPDYLESYSIKGERHYLGGEHWEYYLGTGSEMVSLRITWKEGTGGKLMSKMENVPVAGQWLNRRITALAADR